MNETLQQIIDEIERGFCGDPWHGPSLLGLLKDVDHTTASATRVHGAHTIAEIVVHLTAWKEIVTERLRCEEAVNVTPERDWPHAKITSASEWQAALQRLSTSEQNLILAISQFDQTRMEQTIPGKQHTFAIELRGVAQHDAYHGGQIALLKRA